MSLSRKEFDVLTSIEASKSPDFTQQASGHSLGSVNKTLHLLEDAGLVSENQITEKGLEALEPYRVKRAVLLAAGFGSRLVPVTLNTPKPLVRVKGVRMIDTLLDAVLAAGIEDIVIVRGYLGEQFDQLLYKYPQIRFIENPAYNESNNSNYLGVPTEKTDDWCFETKNRIITKLKVGGLNCHHMFGISYWNQHDGAQMAEHIREVFTMPGGRERYWDQVALEYFIKNYKIEVRECTFDDIIEVDSFSDLKKLDHSYCC